MKKKNTKKLVLHKTTMTHLSAAEQRQLRGGADPQETKFTGYGMCLCNPTKLCTPESAKCVFVQTQLTSSDCIYA